MKLYKCEFPNCEKEVVLRTTIKDKESEYYGLRVCSTHGSMLRKKTISDKTKRTQKARQEQRKNYPEFYQTMIDYYRGKRCIETGQVINNPTSVNIAHVLSKSTSPEVATNPFNIVLMTEESHKKFDSNLKNRASMKCIDEVVYRYKGLKSILTNITSETLFFDEYLTKF